MTIEELDELRTIMGIHKHMTTQRMEELRNFIEKLNLKSRMDELEHSTFKPIQGNIEMTVFTGIDLALVNERLYELRDLLWKLTINKRKSDNASSQNMALQNNK